MTLSRRATALPRDVAFRLRHSRSTHSAALKARVLRFQPCPRPTTHITRADALRDDALQAHAARSLHKADGTGSETAGTTAAKKTARGKAQTSAPATRHAALGGQKRLTFWQLCPSFAIKPSLAVSPCGDLNQPPSPPPCGVEPDEQFQCSSGS